MFIEKKDLIFHPLPDDIQYFAGTSKHLKEFQGEGLEVDLGSTTAQS